MPSDDRLVTPSGEAVSVEARSMVGIIPMLAALVVDESVLDQAQRLRKRVARFLYREGLHDREKLVDAGLLRGRPGERQLLLGVVGTDRLERMFEKLFDENEFLSPYGLRAISAHHREYPYELDVEGMRASVDYEPAESTTAMFGGNSNWRGPLWFPLNYLVVSALERYHDFTVEYPTGSGHRVPLDVVGAGLGASHQTGWTGIVADVIRRRHGVVPSVGDVLRSADPQRPMP